MILRRALGRINIAAPIKVGAFNVNRGCVLSGSSTTRSVCTYLSNFIYSLMMYFGLKGEEGGALAP
jgi:hypothetical protein